MTKTIRVPDPLHAMIQKYADEHDISMGAAARELIQPPEPADDEPNDEHPNGETNA